MDEKVKILFLAAGADEKTRRRSEQEARAISTRLRASRERDSFVLITSWAVRATDLQALLLEHKPHVVHLSGRVNEAGDILLPDDREGSRPVSLQAVAGLFRILKDNIRLVVLNVPHADGIAQHLRWIIDFAVSMKGAIDEEAAVTFSAHLYQALGFGRTMSEAFGLAVNQLKLEGNSGHEQPSLYVKVGADKSRRLMPAPADTADETDTVRQLSQIAVSDAQFITNDRFGMFGGDVRLDQGLYVIRRLEQSLSHVLAKKKATPDLVLVVGDAGNGKTSLLWHVYHTLPRSEGWEPLFIKSTLFLSGDLAMPGAPAALKAAFSKAVFSSDSLLAITAESAARGLRPVILLDTVDLLLRDEEGRDFLLKLLLTLRARGCAVVATSRPQEAVLLYSIDHVKLTLGGYETYRDYDELTEAINKYAARFYARSVQKNYAEEFAHVRDAVARGLPVREVCANPLTLRMLFTIYAPAAIPEDINVFRLYQEYWAQRVGRDLRGGSPFPAPRSADLGQAAAGVAVAMLAEGTPELDRQRLGSALTALGRTQEGVGDLIDRGILHDSEAGTVAFFHQTFFEHSAARGLLMWRGVGGLSVLRERRHSRPNDLFVGPVYEQALLLSEQETAPVAEAAEQLLAELLQSDVLTLRLSGVYVYCHRQKVSDATAKLMRTFLLGADESSVMRFLELSPNTPGGRLAMLFSELDVIWRRGNWREQEHLLKLLERLVPRNCDEVKKFVEQHGLLEYVLGKPAGFSGEWKLLRMLTAVAEYDPEWSLRILTELYLKAIPRVESRELQAAVLNTLCERADLFGAREIATRFETATAHVKLDRARNVEALSIAYGRLLSVEWRARGRPLRDILEEVRQTEGALKLAARMRGLVFALWEGDERDAEEVFSWYQAEAETPREWLWTRVVWPQMLAGPDDSAKGSAVVAYARREAARILSEECTAGVGTRLAERIRTSVREAALPPEVLLKLLDIPALVDPAPWLRADGYASLFADAFVAGHPGAAAAMGQLLDDPARLWPGIKHVVSPRLKRLGAVSEPALEALVSIALKSGDELHLLRALEQSTPGMCQTRKDDLCAFRQQLLRSPSSRKRSTAVMLWSQLLRLGLAPAPPLDELLLMLDREGDACTRGHLVTLMGQAASDTSADIGGLVDVLISLAVSSDIDIREKALAGVVKIVAEAPGAYAMRVLDAALARPTNAARLSLMRILIKKLIDDDVELAARLFEKLLTGAKDAGLGFNGSRKLLGRFKLLTRSLVRAAPAAVSRRLLNLVPELDRVLGVLVVDSICHEVMNGLGAELDELLKQDIHNDVKQVILRYKYVHERPSGWPELYALLHGGAHTSG